MSLAKALLNQPEVLLLDEPTASLDPDIGDRMRTYLEDYQRQSRCTMLLASHNMGEVERMCDDVIMLRAGIVVDQGSPEDADRALRSRRHGRGVSRHRARRSDGARAGRRRGKHRVVRIAVDMPAHPSIALYPQTGVAASARRVRALVRRHAYLLFKSWPRMISMAYYPTVTMVLWAFLTDLPDADDQFLKDAPGFFIGAVLLWDVLFRGQLGVSLTFVEELYSRNLGNLFVSPLRLREFIAGQLVMSVLRTLIGVGGACVFAFCSFTIRSSRSGFPLIAFFVLLIVFGWAIGLACPALILRWGLGAEELAWAAIFLVAPVSGVYYPIAVLPPWLQVIAYALPSAHVFEGMRALLLERDCFAGIIFGWATGLECRLPGRWRAAVPWAIAYAREHGMLHADGRSSAGARASRRAGISGEQRLRWSEHPCIGTSNNVRRSTPRILVRLVCDSCIDP